MVASQSAHPRGIDDWLLSKESGNASACSFSSFKKGLNPSEYTMGDHFQSLVMPRHVSGNGISVTIENTGLSNGFDTYYVFLFE